MVVHAGADGVGSLAIQLGGCFQAGRVIATASSEDKRQLCLELGADEGRQVDVVFEMTRGDVFSESPRALAPFGRLVTYGMGVGREGPGDRRSAGQAVVDQRPTI